MLNQTKHTCTKILMDMSKLAEICMNENCSNYNDHDPILYLYGKMLESCNSVTIPEIVELF